MAFSKTIQIDVASCLTGPSGWDDVKIVMAFNQNAIQCNTAFTPVSWRVATVLLNQQETQSIIITYVSGMGVSKAQVSVGKIVEPGLNLRLGVDQQTNLLLVEGTPSFTKPVSFVPGKLGVNNNLTSSPTIAAGLYDSTDPSNFLSIAVWQSVLNNTTIDIEFTPTLSIYAASAFKRGQTMSPDLHGLLWRHNLKDVDLPNPVKFNLVYNAVQNEYQLQQVKV